MGKDFRATRFDGAFIEAAKRGEAGEREVGSQPRREQETSHCLWLSERTRRQRPQNAP